MGLGRGYIGDGTEKIEPFAYLDDETIDLRDRILYAIKEARDALGTAEIETLSERIDFADKALDWASNNFPKFAVFCETKTASRWVPENDELCEYLERYEESDEKPKRPFRLREEWLEKRNFPQ